ncbi:RNA polymerase sigma-70 factor [Parapedobacter tibetensis]|uniref:RNA polymerase sigma-70 factor n=1 Tax=Parapedobacter tibetensis TaxID=2972951 RepID=UPI00214DE10F|nr:RNA polymerase sigma-70 factor [Parapedobacter tibetensis]
MKNKPETFTVEELFDRYYIRLCEFAYRIVSCRETSRDLVQDAFVVLMENRCNIKQDTHAIKSYLYSTVKHAALNSIRRHSIIDRIHRQNQPQVMEEAEITHAMIHAEILGELHAALETLPKGCAEVCKMAYFEGKKNQEIADAIGVSINTIKTQKQRAIALLRNKISQQTMILLIPILLR